MLGVLFEAVGQLDEALQEYQQAVELDPDSGTAHVAMASVYRRFGRQDAWTHQVAQARRLAKPDDHYSLACLESVAGNTDLALKRLAQVLEKRPELRAWAARDPRLEWISDDPRFQESI